MSLTSFANNRSPIVRLSAKSLTYVAIRIGSITEPVDTFLQGALSEIDFNPLYSGGHDSVAF